MNFSQLMISSSTGTSRLFFFLAAICFCGCNKPSQAKEVPSPGKSVSTGRDTLYERCTVSACSVFAVDRTGKEKFLLDGSQSTFVQHLKGSLYKVRISCGNPCSGTTYMELASGRKTGPFTDVVAEDPEHFLVAYMLKKGIGFDCMLPCKAKAAEFNLPLSPVAAPILALDTAFFESGRLVVHYSTGRNFDPAVDTLEIPGELGGEGNK